MKARDFRQRAAAGRRVAVVTGYGRRGFSTGGFSVDVSADDEEWAVSFGSQPAG